MLQIPAENGRRFRICLLLGFVPVYATFVAGWWFGYLPPIELATLLIAVTAGGVIGAYFTKQALRLFFASLGYSGAFLFVLLWCLTGIGWDGFPVTLVSELAYSMMDRKSYELALEAINDGNISPAHVKAWREFEALRGLGRFCLLGLVLLWSGLLRGMIEAHRKNRSL